MNSGEHVRPSNRQLSTLQCMRTALRRAIRVHASLRSARALAALLVTLATLLVACGGSDGASDTADAGPTRAAEAAESFVVPTVDGGQLAAGDLEGRDVALWFWAPW